MGDTSNDDKCGISANTLFTVQDVVAIVTGGGTDHGRLDVLVNAAGVMAIWHKKFDVPDDGSVYSIQKLLMTESESHWAAQFRTNVTAVYFLVGAFLPLMKASNDHWKNLDGDRDLLTARTAQVITVTGIAALSRKMGGCMGYVASKAGVLQLMKTLATVLAPAGIRFNSIAPGIFPSEITAGKGHLDAENRNHLGPLSKTGVPQGRAGDVRDMAGATLFLCGRGGFYCNGAVVVMDGGRLSINPSSF